MFDYDPLYPIEQSQQQLFYNNQQQQQSPLFFPMMSQQQQQHSTLAIPAPLSQQLQERVPNHQQNLSINSILSLQSSILEPLTPPELSSCSVNGSNNNGNSHHKFSPWNSNSLSNIIPSNAFTTSSATTTSLNNSNNNHYTYQHNYNNVNSSSSKLDLLLTNNGDFSKMQQAQQAQQPQQQKRVMSMPQLQPAINFNNVSAAANTTATQVNGNNSRKLPPSTSMNYSRSNSFNYMMSNKNNTGNMNQGMMNIGPGCNDNNMIINNGNSGHINKKSMDRDIIMKLNSVPFETLSGEILSLSKDQYGCRFLQKKIDESTANFKMIFNEIYPFSFELMIDPFGNYLVQKILDFCSDVEKNLLIKNCCSNLFSIALNQHGTRALQKMIDCVSTEIQISMIRDALSNYVVELIQDLNGNHVIQKCINKFSSEDCQFIITSICANIIKVSTHKHGCCVLQKCLNNCNLSQLQQLSDEIINNSIVLMQDQFGNYVVQYLLSLNNYQINEKLIWKIIPSIPILSIQKFSSNVVEKCLKISSINLPLQSLMIEIILIPQNLAILMKDQFGNYVIQTALDISNEEYKLKLIANIKPLITTIKTTPFGRRIQSKISMILNSNPNLNHQLLMATSTSNNNTNTNINAATPNISSSSFSSNALNTNNTAPTNSTFNHHAVNASSATPSHRINAANSISMPSPSLQQQQQHMPSFNNSSQQQQHWQFYNDGSNYSVNSFNELNNTNLNPRGGIVHENRNINNYYTA